MIYIDDGYKETFKYAFPLLKKYNIRAVWSIPIGLLGGKLEGGEIMSIEDIKELVKDGQIIASHSITHPQEITREEIVQSRVELEKLLGVKIMHFVFPYENIPSKELLDLANSEYKVVRPFYNYAFHLISPETFDWYPFHITPEKFEDYMKYEKRN